MHPSMPLTAFFCATVLVVGVLVALGALRAGLHGVTLVAILLAYLVVPGVLASRGALNRYDPLPAPALLLVFGLTIVTVVLTSTGVGRRLADRVPLGAVVALQGFRIPVEWCLHRLASDGVVPMSMTFGGRNFDIVTGVTGLGLGLWMLTGRPARRATVWTWNALGLALLANIIVIAVLSTPVPFRRFTEGPPNLLPSTFPFVWLPSFLVQVALASHLLVFRQLARRGRRLRA